MKQKISNRPWIIIGLLSVILIGFILNTLLFQRTLYESIALDLYNNNHAVAEQIAMYVKSKNESMVDFADTLARMPERVVTEDLLYRKSEAFDMDAVAVFRQDGQDVSYMGEGAELAAFVKEEWEELRNPRIAFLDQDTLVFTAPVVVDGKLWKVLAGRNKYPSFYAPYYEKAMVGLVDTATGRVLNYRKGTSSSIGNEMAQALWKEAVKHSGERMQTGRYIVADEKIEGTSWAYISMIRYRDLNREFSHHTVFYMILAFLEFCILIVGLYLLRKQVERERLVLLTDPLTGGFNRAGFIKKCEEVTEREDKEHYYVVRLNIVDFRYINESWGEDAGNRTLQFIYRIFREGLTEKETICRVNVDHFLLLLHESDEGAAASRITERIKWINSYIQQNFFSYNLDFQVGGCSLSKGQDVPEVVRNAVYVSKMSTERNVCAFYDEKIMVQIANNHELDESFYESLRNKDFKIYFQPKVSRDSVCEAEALVRWQHPKKGLLFPGQFIPLFEQNGKIMDLDFYVFEELCRIVSQWIKEKKTISPISVNVSRYSLLNAGEGIYKKYGAIKERYEIPDGLLEIELTETALMDGNQLSFVRGVLNGFRSCGFRVALDDFGVAYSSLGLLKALEVDTIKIDRTFFINSNQKSEKIVYSIIQLLHSLNMNVVAEGIEEEEQSKKLYEDGCDYIQGYVYSKAISQEEFENWQKERSK